MRLLANGKSKVGEHGNESDKEKAFMMAIE